MGRLIDEEELEKYIIHDDCEKGCGYIDERDLKYIPTVQAISKADYEARLKADMADMLMDLQHEIKTRPCNSPDRLGTYSDGLDKGINIIQEKINSLR